MIDAYDNVRFKELQETLKPWLMKVAKDYAPAGHAEDYTQEALLAIWQSLRTESPRQMEAWAKVIARRRMTSLYRDARAQLRDETKYVFVDDMSVFDGPELVTPDMPPRARDMSVLAAVTELPDLQREYVELRFWGGYSTEDLGHHFGRGAYYSRDIWRRAKKSLTKALAQTADVTA